MFKNIYIFFYFDSRRSYLCVRFFSCVFFKGYSPEEMDAHSNFKIFYFEAMEFLDRNRLITHVGFSTKKGLLIFAFQYLLVEC